MDRHQHRIETNKNFDSVFDTEDCRVRQMSIPGIFNMGQFDISKDYGVFQDYIMATSCRMGEKPISNILPFPDTVVAFPVKKTGGQMDNFVFMKKFADIDCQPHQEPLTPQLQPMKSVHHSTHFGDNAESAEFSSAPYNKEDQEMQLPDLSNGILETTNQIYPQQLPKWFGNPIKKGPIANIIKAEKKFCYTDSMEICKNEVIAPDPSRRFSITRRALSAKGIKEAKVKVKKEEVPQVFFQESDSSHSLSEPDSAELKSLSSCPPDPLFDQAATEQFPTFFGEQQLDVKHDKEAENSCNLEQFNYL